MGTWGPDSFQNDWALDWLGDLRERGDTSFVRATLSQVVEHGGTKHSPPSFLERLRGRRHHTDWLNASVAAKSIAAAEIVAAWRGHPSSNLPDSVITWVQQYSSSFQSDLVALAQKATAIVKTNSELRDLREQSDADGWQNAVEDLERRLTEK